MRFIKRAASMAVLAVAMLSAGQALAFRTPEAVIRAIYLPLIGDNRPAPDPFRVYSPQTLERIRTYQALNFGLLGWLPFSTNAPIEIANLDARQVRLDAASADIVVTFTNFGQPNQLTYNMVREMDGWRVDDISGIIAGGPWSLRDASVNGPVRFVLAEEIILP